MHTAEEFINMSDRELARWITPTENASILGLLDDNATLIGIAGYFFRTQLKKPDTRQPSGEFLSILNIEAKGHQQNKYFFVLYRL